MNKLLKKIIIYLIIFTFAFPTFAGLSSDDSAFITKEEFDGVLSDFNDRLERFEVNINSKIDQQVTTYLDRNGIWSANEQTLNKKNFVWTFGIATGTELTYKDGKKIKVDATGYSNLPNVQGGCFYKLRDNSYVLVSKINKTGLCCLMYSSYSNGAMLADSYFSSGSDRRGWFYPASTTSSYRNNATKWDNSIYIYHPVKFNMSSRKISDSIARFSYIDMAWGMDSATPGFYFMPMTSSGILYFFVEKGYPLYFVEYQSVQFNTNYAAGCLQNAVLNKVGGNYTGLRIDFNSVNVY